MQMRRQEGHLLDVSEIGVVGDGRVGRLGRRSRGRRSRSRRLRDRRDGHQRGTLHRGMAGGRARRTGRFVEAAVLSVVDGGAGMHETYALRVVVIVRVRVRRRVAVRVPVVFPFLLHLESCRRKG